MRQSCLIMSSGNWVPSQLRKNKGAGLAFKTVRSHINSTR